jgi:hypothetical protein
MTTIILEAIDGSMVADGKYKLVLHESQVDDALALLASAKELFAFKRPRKSDKRMVELRTKFLEEEGYMVSDAEVVAKYGLPL